METESFCIWWKWISVIYPKHNFCFSEQQQQTEFSSEWKQKQMSGNFLQNEISLAQISLADAHSLFVAAHCIIFFCFCVFGSFALKAF